MTLRNRRKFQQHVKRTDLKIVLLCIMPIDILISFFRLSFLYISYTPLYRNVIVNIIMHV